MPLTPTQEEDLPPMTDRELFVGKLADSGRATQATVEGARSYLAQDPQRQAYPSSSGLSRELILGADEGSFSRGDLPYTERMAEVESIGTRRPDGTRRKGRMDLAEERERDGVTIEEQRARLEAQRAAAPPQGGARITFMGETQDFTKDQIRDGSIGRWRASVAAARQTESRRAHNSITAPNQSPAIDRFVAPEAGVITDPNAGGTSPAARPAKSSALSDREERIRKWYEDQGIIEPRDGGDGPSGGTDYLLDAAMGGESASATPAQVARARVRIKRLERSNSTRDKRELARLKNQAERAQAQAGAPSEEERLAKIAAESIAKSAGQRSVTEAGTSAAAQRQERGAEIATEARKDAAYYDQQSDERKAELRRGAYDYESENNLKNDIKKLEAAGKMREAEQAKGRLADLEQLKERGKVDLANRQALLIQEGKLKEAAAVASETRELERLEKEYDIKAKKELELAQSRNDMDRVTELEDQAEARRQKRVAFDRQSVLNAEKALSDYQRNPATLPGGLGVDPEPARRLQERVQKARERAAISGMDTTQIQGEQAETIDYDNSGDVSSGEVRQAHEEWGVHKGVIQQNAFPYSDPRTGRVIYVKEGGFAGGQRVKAEDIAKAKKVAKDRMTELKWLSDQIKNASF